MSFAAQSCLSTKKELLLLLLTPPRQTHSFINFIFYRYLQALSTAQQARRPSNFPSHASLLYPGKVQARQTSDTNLDKARRYATTDECSGRGTGLKQHRNAIRRPAHEQACGSGLHARSKQPRRKALAHVSAMEDSWTCASGMQKSLDPKTSRCLSFTRIARYPRGSTPFRLR